MLLLILHACVLSRDLEKPSCFLFYCRSCATSIALDPRFSTSDRNAQNFAHHRLLKLCMHNWYEYLCEFDDVDAAQLLLLLLLAMRRSKNSRISDSTLFVNCSSSGLRKRSLSWKSSFTRNRMTAVQSWWRGAFGNRAQMPHINTHRFVQSSRTPSRLSAKLVE